MNGELEPRVTVLPPPLEYAEAEVLDPERLNDFAPDELVNLSEAPWDFALLELELELDPPFAELEPPLVEPPFPLLELRPPPPPFLLTNLFICSSDPLQFAAVRAWNRLGISILDVRDGGRTE